MKNAVYIRTNTQKKKKNGNNAERIIVITMSV